MTARTPTYLKSRFEQNDIPTGTDYEDVFDSFINVETSASQTVAGAIVFSNRLYGLEINSPLVSATSGIFSFVSAQTATIDFITSQRTSANSIYSASANLTNLITSTVSAATLNANSANILTVSANDINVSGAVYLGCLDVSALATTQASTITLTATNSFIIYATGDNLAVKLPTSIRGREQRIINAASTTLKIFPSTSGRFLVTAVNASLNLPADKTALVIHQGDDRYSFMVG